MIRATIISVIDQALLSALNFGLSVLLIHYASKQEYGLYSQLINLQPFFSPLHAGIFVSAFLALAAKMDAREFSAYQSRIARVELGASITMCVIVVGIISLGAKYFGFNISFMTCLAFGLALIGLWWREFVRQIQFARMKHVLTLKIDATYCVVTVALILVVLATSGFNTTAALWCMGIGGVIATALPLFQAIRHETSESLSYRQSIAMSWQMGRWEVLGSVLTWGYAQSYVYFAALHGGLDAAAEVAAGRLLATPLSLMWASYANVLRPSASRLLATSSYQETNQLALRSTGFVVGSSVLYALVVYFLVPIVNQKLFGNKFDHLQSLSMWWIAYVGLTGITTIASSVLRSGMQFRQVFTRQLITCAIAVLLLSASLKLPGIHSLVVALIAVEMISAIQCWRQMHLMLHRSDEFKTEQQYKQLSEHPR